jgi:hypothetical protein
METFSKLPDLDTSKFPMISPNGLRELMEALLGEPYIDHDVINSIKTPSSESFNDKCDFHTFDRKIEKLFSKKKGRKNSKTYVEPLHPYSTRNRHRNKSLGPNTRSKNK